MHDSKTLSDRAMRTLKASSSDTRTAAGRTDSEQRETGTASADKTSIIDAINQVFAEFELVFHNQYNKAFSTPEKLMYAKKLWYSYLREYTPEQILAAAHRAIRESEFLPTVRGLLKYLDQGDAALGLPDTHTAFVEACRAGHPKSQQPWSHPAVYYAGKNTGWFFLANNTESTTYPVFKRNYGLLCERVRRGENIELPLDKALPEHSVHPLSAEENKQRLKAVREKFNL